MIAVDLPYGASTVRLHLPEERLAGVYQPLALPGLKDLTAGVFYALTHPLGTLSLSQTVRPGEKVVILVDDHTRNTPADQILPPVLEELHRAGVPSSDITLLVTHGTHRASTEEEVRRKVGDDVYSQYRILQHDCTDEANHRYVGLTSRGTPVWVNRVVLEADRRVGIGHIGPSPYAGYSGGGKLILPGAASLDTINANHSLVPLGFRRPGRTDVPCRLDIDEASAMVGLDFVVDVVLSWDEQVVGVFAGSPDLVFQAGVALARRLYEVPCAPVDIAVTSAYPYDIDLYQAVRAVEYADAVVRPGGSILLVAACPEGIGGDEFYRLMADSEKRPEDFLRDVVRRNGPVTFSVLGYALARIKAEKRLYILTEGIPAPALEAMGFRPVRSLQEGLDALLLEYGATARVAVFPAGAATIPVLRESGEQIICESGRRSVA